MAEREPAMQRLHDVLERVPPEYHEQVANELENTAKIILRTLEMVRKAG